MRDLIWKSGFSQYGHENGGQYQATLRLVSGEGTKLKIATIFVLTLLTLFIVEIRNLYPGVRSNDGIAVAYSLSLASVQACVLALDITNKEHTPSVKLEA